MVEQKDSLDGLLNEDVSHLRMLVQKYRDNPKFTTEHFFSLALFAFYDVMDEEGINGTTGHIIYRMSDAVIEKQRETIPIYPDSTGSLILPDEGDPWDSLEDWRKQWQRLHPVIPVLTKQLSEEFKLE